MTTPFFGTLLPHNGPLEDLRHKLHSTLEDEVTKVLRYYVVSIMSSRLYNGSGTELATTLLTRVSDRLYWEMSNDGDLHVIYRALDGIDYVTIMDIIKYCDALKIVANQFIQEELPLL